MTEKVAKLIKYEEVGMFALAVYLNTFLPFEWWWYLVFFFLPDIGMIGYLRGPVTGAFTYNLFHHKGVAVLFYLSGLFLANHELQFTGLVLFGHSSFDRILGYGLKFDDNFKNTHLGWIGRATYGK